MRETDGALVDVEAVHWYLQRELGPEAEFEIERADGGVANETLFLTWGDRDLVLRRSPPEATADNAHEVLRDFVFFESLADTAVPVPEPVARCSDSSLIGSKFYLAERIEGVVPHPEEPPNFGDETTRRQVSETVVDTLARIHTLDYESVGLADFGRPDGFTERQVSLWQRQLEWATTTTGDVRSVSALDAVGDWLHKNVPATTPGPTIVHGDYGLHNLMFSRTSSPDITGVLDWEMGTVGNPLADLGWLLTFWFDGSESSIPTAGLLTPFVDRDGYLSKRALVKRYEDQAGVAFDNRRFYLVLGIFKLAAVSEMFYARHLGDGSETPSFEEMRTVVPAYAERAHRLIEATDPLAV